MPRIIRTSFEQGDCGRRGRNTDPASAHRMLLLKVDENLHSLLSTSSLDDAGAAKNALADLVAGFQEWKSEA